MAVLNNVVVWMVSTRPPTSKSSSPFSNPLVTVPNAPITIGIIVTFMFHTFFNSLARMRYLFFFSLYFSFILLSAGTAKSTILHILFFFHKTVPQPPYSPDLAPCDFWLLPKLRGCRYETIEEMKEVVTKVIDTLPHEVFHGAFQKLLER